MHSSTLTIPDVRDVPRHVAIIMDGNGRWAKKRLLPRVAGHKRGLEAVREAVRFCCESGIDYLTLFAFSSENWRRPQEEVSFLMGLFLQALEREVDRLHQRDIRLRIVGNLTRFSGDIQERIAQAEARTAGNTGLTLSICADYGGRWDILRATNALLEAGFDTSKPVTEADLAPFLSMAYAPEPDLFIRTGGERRISNFLLWQLAYTELYFTDTLWPDFDHQAFEAAVVSYRSRERRFGRTSEQLPPALQRP